MQPLQLKQSVPVPCLAQAMAGIVWTFGRGGANIQVTNINGESSSFSAAQPLDEFNISIDVMGESTRAPELLPSQEHITHHPAGNIVSTVTPVQVNASISFVDEGLVNITYVIEKDQISGKGRGKGLGKSINM